MGDAGETPEGCRVWVIFALSSEKVVALVRGTSGRHVKFDDHDLTHVLKLMQGPCHKLH